MLWGPGEDADVKEISENLDHTLSSILKVITCDVIASRCFCCALVFLLMPQLLMVVWLMGQW